MQPHLLFLNVILLLTGLIAGCSEEVSTQAKEASLSFTDVTEAAGLGDFVHQTGAQGEKWFPEIMGSGGGFFDFDGDTWADILLVGGGAWDSATDSEIRKLWLYRNNGDLTFTLVSDEAGLSWLPGMGFGISTADVDNDGDEDIYLSTLEHGLLLRNDEGVFTDVSKQSGLAARSEWSSSAMFFDADSDADLDLVVGNYVSWTPSTDLWCTKDGERKDYCTPELYEGLPVRFYRNQGDATFVDATLEAGLDTTAGKVLGVAELDFDRDGLVDIAVANDTDPDQLYRNRGDGTFEEIGVLSGMAFDERGRARAGMGIDAGVVDQTGEITIFVGNFANQMIGVYRHLGGGAFVDRAATSQIGRSSLLSLTFGVFLFDVDLDGDLDLFGANGHVQPDVERIADNISFRQPPHLFINRGEGVFQDMAPEIGGVLADSIVARGAAYADIDHDGDLDILVTENGGPAHLWRNDSPRQASYLRVRLEGRKSNRSALGTRVEIVSNGIRQERRVRSGSSYLSQSEKPVTFGGIGPSVDSVLVFWPSGITERFHNVPADQELFIVESLGIQ